MPPPSPRTLTGGCGKPPSMPIVSPTWLGRVAVAASLATGAACGADAQPSPLRYQLQPGDHLVYREHLSREVSDGQSRTRTAVEWTTHVLVAGPGLGGWTMGFQRNRTAAELVQATDGGRDVTAAQRAAFDERLRATKPRSDRERKGLAPP